MAGGSLLIRRLQYIGASDYIQPPDTRAVKPLYDFINTQLATTLQSMIPLDLEAC